MKLTKQMVKKLNRKFKGKKCSCGGDRNILVISLENITGIKGKNICCEKRMNEIIEDYENITREFINEEIGNWFKD